MLRLVTVRPNKVLYTVLTCIIVVFALTLTYIILTVSNQISNTDVNSRTTLARLDRQISKIKQQKAAEETKILRKIKA